MNAPIPVTVEKDGDGNPKNVRGARFAPPETGLTVTHAELSGKNRAPLTAHHSPVETILDTWQLDDEWWRQRISRRYVAVMVEGGKRMLLFEDLVTGEWFEQTP